jgi:hypothetical protein
MIFQKKINKYFINLFINRFLKKTTVHENGKQKITLSCTGILNTNRRQFCFLNLFYSKQLKKLQLKLSRSTIAIYPYEKL